MRKKSNTVTPLSKGWGSKRAYVVTDRASHVIEAADRAAERADAMTQRRATTEAIMKLVELLDVRHAEPRERAREIAEAFDIDTAWTIARFSIQRLERASACLAAFVAAIRAEME